MPRLSDLCRRLTLLEKKPRLRTSVSYEESSRVCAMNRVVAAKAPVSFDFGEAHYSLVVSSGNSHCATRLCRPQPCQLLSRRCRLWHHRLQWCLDGQRCPPSSLLVRRWRDDPSWHCRGACLGFPKHFNKALTVVLWQACRSQLQTRLSRSHCPSRTALGEWPRGRAPRVGQPTPWKVPLPFLLNLTQSAR